MTRLLIKLGSITLCGGCLSLLFLALATAGPIGTALSLFLTVLSVWGLFEAAREAVQEFLSRR